MSTSDEMLFAAHQQGDQAAFSELFRRYAPILVRALTRRVGHAVEAQDLTQQTFLHLHRARHDFRPGDRLRPWLMTIAFNLARDHLRTRGRRPQTELDETTLPAPEVDLPLEVAQERARVLRALAELPAPQREVIELHWYADLSFPEIANVLGTSPGAVRVRAHRGYTALRLTLQ